MVKCIFCGKDENSFRGLTILKNDGSTAYYCSGKCRKNVLHLKRDKRKIKWTEAYGIKLAKDVAKAAKIAEETKVAAK